jgi:hypothetical protein
MRSSEEKFEIVDSIIFPTVHRKIAPYKATVHVYQNLKLVFECHLAISDSSPAGFH